MVAGRSMRMGLRLMLAALLGCAATALLSVASAEAAYPKGKNGDIAYQVFDDQFDVFTMAPNGARQANLTNAPTYEVDPTYSPDGRRIAFVRDVGFETDVWVMNVNGTNALNLTNTPGVDEFQPAYSPDGRFIVFNGDEEEPVVELHRMNADGSGRIALTATPGARETEADFSPDGRRVVFQRCAPSCDIYSMAPDGSAVVNLTPGTPATGEYEPAYSPDGRRIVFVQAGVPDTEIAIMNSDGTGAVTLTSNDFFENSPAFSPDGRLVSFTANPDGEDTEVLTVSAAGPGPFQNLTNNAGIRDEGPAWQSLHRCAGRRVTITGDEGPDKIKGTKKADVIAGFGGKDVIRGLGGSDRICAGGGKDKISGGGGKKDLCRGQKGKDKGFKGCERGKL